jgi:hypothetical protein
VTTPFPQPASPATRQATSDKTTLWGVLGIIFGLLLWPLGLVFAVLSMNEARRGGRTATLAVIGVLVSVFALVMDIYYFARR